MANQTAGSTWNQPHPPCTWCGGPVERRAGERLADYQARCTCSRRCAGQSGRAAQQLQSNWHREQAIARHPPCLCGKHFLPREGEQLCRYAARATCGDPACLAEQKRRSARRELAAAPHDDGPAPVEPAVVIVFSGHDVDPGDGGFLRVARPDARTYAGVASGW